MNLKYSMGRATVYAALLIAFIAVRSWAHEAKDFDDSILYKIEFDVPDFDKNPDLTNHLKTFYTHEKEKYDCVIPVVEDAKEDKKSGEAEISPLTLIKPIFSATSCSHRIEAYWSYEICHGFHIRQYHEEREGKNIKFQEYYLGKWSENQTKQLIKAVEENRQAGIKHKTTKIDNIKYPYFEMDMTDGTLCDIIGEPRTTKIRYVCYPHVKNDIYSFKETSSCNYEAIILTSLLCMDPNFHPEESKEVPIKCFNSPQEAHKPLSMLRQELSELQMTDVDLPAIKDSSSSSAMIKASATTATGDRYLFVNKFGADVDKLVQELMDGPRVVLERGPNVLGGDEVAQQQIKPPVIADLGPIKELLSGKNCLTGGTGWWKYEFCHRVSVRQIHKDKKSETEIYLGYFDEVAHRQWIIANPDKAFKQQVSNAIWHHYEGGTRCDRTGKPREVDVKLTCTPIASTPNSVSMYLLEPKTCQYILVVESPIICDLMKITDEYGFVDANQFQQMVARSQAKPETIMEGSETSVAGQVELEEETTSQKKNEAFLKQLNTAGATGTADALNVEQVVAHDEM